MKLSDYVAKFLYEHNIKDLFLVSGGGMMHLLDSVAKNNALNLYYNLNEQATSICADSYAQYTNKLSAFLVTTGPGGTNAVTGVAASWLDSTPVLAISGQVKTSDMGTIKGLRQYGAQEVDIVSIVKPITKYAVTIMNKEEIRYHLEKAVYLATHGRRGPVWIDIPLDIQASQIEESKLMTFNPEEEQLVECLVVNQEDISKVYRMLNQAKRPVFLVGHGLVASGRGDVFYKLVHELDIPVLATWRARGIFAEDDLLFMGYPGIPAARYSNYILQNADLVIIMGTRLNASLTAYAENAFAKKAHKVIVDIDVSEVDKLNMDFEMKVISDVGYFVDALDRQKDEYKRGKKEVWMNYCRCIKEKYPLSKEIQPIDNEEKVDGYLFAEKLSKYSKSTDVFIGSSSGRTCGISHMAYKLKKGQKFISSMGLGSMGFTIPSSIAACIASGKKRTLALEGDGSLQHNIQELALIQSYHLPIKLFILSNEGYASIYMMQKNNFAQNYAGCISDQHFKFPSLEQVARAYGLSYYLIQHNDEIDEKLNEIMKDEQAAICEVKGSIYFDEIPKSMTKVNTDGTFSSSSLENLYPFLKEEEVKENMPNWEA